MKKVDLIIVLLFSSFATLAQSEKSTNEKKLTLGFNIGLHHTDLHAAEALPANASIANNLGIRLGFLANYQVSRMLSFTPKAEISFHESQVNVGDTQAFYEVPTTLELMTHAVFRNESMKLSPYFLFGPNVKIPVSNDAANSSTNTDLAIDFGFGIMKGFSKFNFAPEIRYSYGLRNIHQDPSIGSLRYNNVVLVLNFLGAN